MSKEKILYIRERKNKVREIDIKPFIVKLEALKSANGLDVTVILRMSQKYNIKPLEILDAIYSNKINDKTLIKQRRLNLLFL